MFVLKAPVSRFGLKWSVNFESLKRTNKLLAFYDLRHDSYFLLIEMPFTES